MILRWSATYAGKPIKIEIVKDEDAPSRAPPPPAAPPSLLQRLGGATPKGAAAATSGPYVYILNYVSWSLNSPPLPS